MAPKCLVNGPANWTTSDASRHRLKSPRLDPRRDEVAEASTALIEAARGNLYGHRDATMILLTHQPGLRAAEVCDLRWDQVDFSGAVLHVRRVKNGTPSTHPIQG
jgi:integrase